MRQAGRQAEEGPREEGARSVLGGRHGPRDAATATGRRRREGQRWESGVARGLRRGAASGIGGGWSCSRGLVAAARSSRDPRAARGCWPERATKPQLRIAQSTQAQQATTQPDRPPPTAEPSALPAISPPQPSNSRAALLRVRPPPRQTAHSSRRPHRQTPDARRQTPDARCPDAARPPAPGGD